MIRETLQQHMQANIGACIDSPVIDGQWHSGRGKGKDKISYVGHHLPKGLLVRYRHWKESGDECFTWKEWGDGQGIHLNAEEYRRRKAEADAKAKTSAAKETKERAELLAILQTIIRESAQADHNHAYPMGKRIIATGARKAIQRYELVPATTESRAQYITPHDLLIPVYSHTGQLQGIQQITTTGYKLMRGTFTDGLLWIGGGLSTGEVPNRLYIAEGWATAVSVHMRTRNPVIVAFATSNLLSAGRWARDRWENAEVVFAVDNDIGSKIRVGGREIENPGKYYAERAALAVNGAVITPPGNEKSDWNDWHTAQIAGKKIPDLL